jgi:hypothetical protein
MEPVLTAVTRARWISTVRGLIPRSYAIDLLGSPANSPSSTSRSRGERRLSLLAAAPAAGLPERRGPVVLVRDRGFRHARPTATAPHPYSTLEPRHERAQRPHDDRGGRGRVVPAVHIARDGIGLADRAIETRESGAIRRNRIRPGPWRLHRRAWFGLSPVRGNRLDRRLCSANVIMEPRWRPAKQRCPDPATALALILVGGRSDGPYRGRSRMLFVSRGTESSQTLRWRGVDSNFQFRCVRRS